MPAAHPAVPSIPSSAGPGREVDGSAWLRALDVVAGLLEGQRWLLAGGLAVPLTIGRFYREHRDLDIIAPIDALRDVDAAMRRGGYRLTTRVCFDLGTRRVTLLLPVRPDGLRIRLRCRKLRFVAQKDAGPLEPSHVDVMPYRLVGGCIAPRNMRRRVPITVGLEGCRVPLPSGRVVSVLDLHYARALMLRPNTSAHRQDLEAIERALDYRSRVIAGPPRSSLATSSIA
jgi:hypothetical protein